MFGDFDNLTNQSPTPYHWAKANPRYDQHLLRMCISTFTWPIAFSVQPALVEKMYQPVYLSSHHFCMTSSSSLAPTLLPVLQLSAPSLQTIIYIILLISNYYYHCNSFEPFNSINCLPRLIVVGYIAWLMPCMLFVVDWYLLILVVRHFLVMV